MAIALVCMVLGFMISVQIRTTQDIKATPQLQRVEELVQRLDMMEKERDDLKAELNNMREASEGESGARLDAIKMSAGLYDAKGPGVTVSIDDSKRQSKTGENPNLYLIHDEDILKVINELWAAGAEAVSINGQRLISRSEVRCAGPTLSVNNVRYSPPYEINAIGDPKNLENALKMRGGVAETLQFWGIQLSIQQAESIVVPAYKGPMKFEYAEPVKEDE
jgi:uncharacterized protein YlxW (UPF0749 family)